MKRQNTNRKKREKRIMTACDGVLEGKSEILERKQEKERERSKEEKADALQCQRLQSRQRKAPR